MSKSQQKFLIFGVIFFCLMIFVFFISCDKSNAVLSPEQGEFFNYTAFDTSGIVVAKGWLQLELQNNLVMGKWDIDRVGSAENIGPQVGSGTLAGEYKEDSIWVDLQPQMRDNNLLLQGCLRNNTYSGKWIFISFIGPTNTGTFTARGKLW